MQLRQHGRRVPGRQPDDRHIPPAAPHLPVPPAQPGGGAAAAGAACADLKSVTQIKDCSRFHAAAAQRVRGIHLHLQRGPCRWTSRGGSVTRWRAGSWMWPSSAARCPRTCRPPSRPSPTPRTSWCACVAGRPTFSASLTNDLRSGVLSHGSFCGRQGHMSVLRENMQAMSHGDCRCSSHRGATLCCKPAPCSESSCTACSLCASTKAAPCRQRRPRCCGATASPGAACRSTWCDLFPAPLLLAPVCHAQQRTQSPPHQTLDAAGC